MEYLDVRIKINPGIFLKDPESSQLGKKIITTSIELIADLGFEGFTFKKLGLAIGSPESSVYRYFESKHKLLAYLICWYWSWVEYRLVFGTINQPSAEQRLKASLLVLTTPVKIDNSFAHINEILLHNIVIAEATKVLHTKEVDAENKQGYFTVYKRIIERIAKIILEYNPDYKFPHMLVSTVMEGVNEQYYLCEHLPSITDANRGKTRVYDFYEDLVFKAIST